MDFNGNQILELKREGVKFHFYTMNKNELISELCNIIGIHNYVSTSRKYLNEIFS